MKLTLSILTLLLSSCYFENKSWIVSYEQSGQRVGLVVVAKSKQSAEAKVERQYPGSRVLWAAPAENFMELQELAK